MIKQMFKLVWNRKRTNVLIIVEVFFSFLVLFAIVAYGAYYLRNYRQPLGFSYQNVWNISMGTIFDRAGGHAPGEKPKQELQQIILAMRDLPEVENVAMINMTPFNIGAWSGPIVYKGREAFSRFNEATDELKDVMDLELVQGRWFEPADEALSYEPAVINTRLRDELFGSQDPIGKEFDRGKHKGPLEPQKPRRIVGVISDFRQHGEFHEPYNYVFYRKALNDSAAGVTSNLLVRLRPGTPVSFEEKIMTRLRAVTIDRTFQIERLERARRSHMRWVLVPMIAAGLVAGFLLLMVGLGMVGVLWQNVSRRTKEIGVRRAFGGHAGDVYKQILGELLVIATIGLLLGAAVVAQVPLLGIVDWMTPGIFAAALAVSIAVIYALAAVAGLYPSWLATKVHPATALHYE
jgi:putative ABC transport system permease protein